MKKHSKFLLRILSVCSALLLASTSAFATHLRGTTISWSPTSVAGQVQFTIQYSQRQSYGGCSQTGCPVGSTLPVSFNFGDGKSDTFNTTITSVNTAEDYISSTGTLVHTYTSAGPFTAYYENTARVSTIKSGHDQLMRMQTTVTPFASPANHSPVVSEPAIITLPLQNKTGFFISASDLDRDNLSYRLATSTEMYDASAFSCTIGQPPGLSVNSSTGQVTWDTTQIVKAGCGYAAPVSGDLWTVQFEVSDLDANGKVKSTVPLDIILKFVSSTEAPPTLTLSNPGPITVQAGTPITFTATGNDAEPNSRVTLNVTGLPVGATSSNLNSALAPAVVSTFNWTPTAAQVGSYVITYSATNDTFEQVLASVTIYVQNIQPPVLSCSAPLTAQYNVPISIPLTVSDPQADAVTVSWALDGTVVKTDNVPATNQTTTLSLNQTFTKLGTHTVAVSATDTDGKTSTCSTTITAAKADQTISFSPLPDVKVGAPDTALTATASSGLAVTYTATGACTIVNGAVHATGAGNCSVTANQAGNANYNAAPAVTQSFNVTKTDQAITFNPAASVTYGVAPITLSATGGASNNPITYTVTGPATISGSTLTVTGVGNVVVTAHQDGNASYNAAPDVAKTIVVNQAAQVITFNPPAAVSYGVAPIALAATGGASNNPITYTVTGPATISGNMLTVTGAGNVVVTAHQAGNANYSAAADVAKTIVVNPADQAITFAPPAAVTYGASPISLSATGGASNNPVTYTVTGPATLSGNTLTLTGAGNVVVTSHQAGNVNYNAAPDVAKTIVVNQAAQAITFNPPAAVSYGAAPITLAATGGASNNPITYTVTGPATLNGNVLTVTAAGNVVVTAHQGGNANYSAAPDVVKTITVNPADQAITFNPPASVAYGSAPIALTATGGASNNPVTYTVTGPATISGNTLTITGPGTVSVTAHQAGNASYNAAADVTKTINVTKGDQAITFNPPATVSYGAAPIALSATGGASNNPVTYTVTGPATISGSTLTVTGPGAVVVTAHQAGNASYNAAADVARTITVAKGDQAVSFNPPASVTYGTAPIALSATGGASNNPVTYTVTGPATLSGNTLTVTGAGNVVVTAHQAGNANYNAAPDVAKTIVVNQAAQTITFNPPASVPTGSQITLSATGGASGNPVTYTVTGPATLKGNVLSVTGAGTIVVTANQAGNANYAAAPAVVQSIAAKSTATVVLSASSTSFDYPNSTNLKACAKLASGVTAAGTITIYDGSTVVSSLKVQGDGCTYPYLSPNPAAGTHNLTAYYTDALNNTGTSNVVTIKVNPGAVTTEVDCWVHDAPYGGDIKCDANPDSGPSSGYMVYSYDNGPLVAVQMNAASHAVFTVPKPLPGTHTIQITYPAQGSWGSSALPLQVFHVAQAPTYLALTPSVWYTTAGKGLTLTAAITSTSMPAPNAAGTVSFYDGGKLLGTAAVNATGSASLPVTALSAGTHSFTATYSGTQIYAAASGAATVSIGN